MKLLVIADVHGNAEALAAVLKQEPDADATVFLGDTVLSGTQPNETMALLEDLENSGKEAILIAGNHDLEMLTPEPFKHWPADWLAFARWIMDTLEPSGFELLRRLKPEGEYRVGDTEMVLHHGVLPGKPAHGLPDTPDERLEVLAGESHVRRVLFGHSHIQFRRTIGDTEFINPGSVGQPRCGKRVACYGLLEDGVFRHCEAEYDPNPWLAALDRIDPLGPHPQFREWLRQGLLSGYGLGKSEPWTRFAQQGYI